MLIVGERRPRKRVLRHLRRYDPRLDIVWNPTRQGAGPDMPGRWEIKEFVVRWGKYSHVLFWELPDRGYKELPASADEIIAALSEIDLSRYTKGERIHFFCEQLPSDRLTRIANRREARKEEAREEAGDYLKRGMGQKRQVGPGPKGRDSFRWDREGRRAKAREDASEW